MDLQEIVISTKTQVVKVKNPIGLHMRPVAEISKLAYGFDAIVAFHKGNKIAHGHSVVEMLMLGAYCGDELKVSAVGKDADEALATIVDYVANYTDDPFPTEQDTGTCTP